MPQAISSSFPVRVGGPVPDFELRAVDALHATDQVIRLREAAGSWLMLIFYPRDFSFVCPTELTAFSALAAEFTRRNCRLLGISVDTLDLHREWLTTAAEDGGLGALQFPLASDPHGELAQQFGAWDESREVATRGLFIIDPEGVLQYAVVHNLSVGRSPDEVLRVLDALQSGGLCPASWARADGTIDPEQALQPGRVLGHYRIRRLIGDGSFGTVFEAWDLRLERPVALKVLKRNINESRNILRDEARAAAKLNHPNICTIYAVEREDGLPLVAMELLAGRPLRDLLDIGLTHERALALAGQIASGLAAAHAQGVVHGDLKPANIMVTSDDVPKVLDFGLSVSRIERASECAAANGGCAVSRTDDADATLIAELPGGDTVGRIYGTPAYMSPAQASGLPATAASDVFSFGLILFEMLTGERAMRDDAPLRIVLRLQHEDVAADLESRLSEADAELVLPLLSREADERPSMTQVGERINAVLHAVS